MWWGSGQREHWTLFLHLPASLSPWRTAGVRVQQVCGGGDGLCVGVPGSSVHKPDSQETLRFTPYYFLIYLSVSMNHLSICEDLAHTSPWCTSHLSYYYYHYYFLYFVNKLIYLFIVITVALTFINGRVFISGILSRMVSLSGLDWKTVRCMLINCRI